ncbi:MAG TPA: polysaccharide deacetylase family protein [Candidatus Aquicultor sp.]|jgi:hypothetical protein
MLTIVHSPAYQAERRYIFDVIFRDFLGLEYQTQEEQRDDINILFEGDPEGKELLVAEVLFKVPVGQWLTMSALPKNPLGIWDISRTPVDARVTSPRVPVLYANTQNSELIFAQTPCRLTLGLDIFGSMFFMLTRYEEAVRPERDFHMRFPAVATTGFREQLLSRPIVNEYLEILWWALKQQWPWLERKQRHAGVLLSHDVDWPMSGSQGPKRVLMSAAADIMRRKEPALAYRRLRAVPYTRQGNFDYDVNNTFDFVMRVSEEFNISSTFFVIAGNTAGLIDGAYTLDDSWIQKLLKSFFDRGHKIGLHTSYNTFCDAAITRSEFKNLLGVCEKLGINQPVWGSRQHFLRWSNPTTWQNLEKAGVGYDSTLTFAELPGFRCGVCYEYPVFDLIARVPLKLRERPLIVMEGTLFDYKGLSFEKAQESIAGFNSTCRKFNGDFTLLWHNSSLITRQQQHWYRSIVGEIST